MNKINKLASIILSITIIITCMTFSINATENSKPYEELKTKIIEALKNNEDSINISSYNIQKDELKNIYFDLFNNEPLLFNVKREYGCYFSEDWVAEEIVPAYLMTHEEYETNMDIFIEKANKYLSYITPDMSDYEKALILFNKIAINCKYDSVSDKVTSNVSNAYGAIVENKAICSGFSLSYKYLLNIVGVESEIRISDNGSHAWNVVKIDGEWFNADVTNCETNRRYFGNLTYNYFLKSDNYMRNKNTSMYTSKKEPKCLSTKYDSDFSLNANSQIYYRNNQLYYFSKEGKLITRNTDTLKETVLYAVSDKWTIEGTNQYYIGNFARLDGKEKFLYFNGPKQIYKLDLSTNKIDTIYNIDNTEQRFYGLEIFDNDLKVTLANSPNSETISSISIKIELLNNKNKNYYIASSWLKSIWGDINGDGVFSITDITFLQRYLVGLVAFSDNQIKTADINNDGNVTIFDCTDGQRILLK